MKNSSYLIYSIITHINIEIKSFIKCCNQRDTLITKINKIKLNNQLYNKYFDSYNNKLYDTCNKIKNNLVTSNIENIYHFVPKIMYNNTNVYMQNNCKRIYNDIENGYYSIKQFTIAYLYELLFKSSLSIHELTNKRIKEIINLFNKKQYNKDLEIFNQLNLNIQNSFKINFNGDNIIFNLIESETISIIFYLYYYNNILTLTQENIILHNIKFLKFEKLINIIYKLIQKNGVNNASI